jgi:hypothetical protein
MRALECVCVSFGAFFLLALSDNSDQFCNPQLHSLAVPSQLISIGSVWNMAASNRRQTKTPRDRVQATADLTIDPGSSASVVIDLRACRFRAGHGVKDSAIRQRGEFGHAISEPAAVVSWKFSSTCGDCYWGVFSELGDTQHPILPRKRVDSHLKHCCGSIVVADPAKAPQRILLMWDNKHSVLTTKEVVCQLELGADAACWLPTGSDDSTTAPILLGGDMDPDVTALRAGDAHDSIVASAARSALRSMAYVSAASADPLSSLGTLHVAPGVRLGAFASGASSALSAASSAAKSTPVVVAAAATMLLRGLQRAPRAAHKAISGMRHLGELATTMEAKTAASAVLSCSASAVAVAATPETRRVAADASRLLASVARWLQTPEVEHLAVAGKEAASAAVAVANRPEAALAARALVHAAAEAVAEAADAATGVFEDERSPLLPRWQPDSETCEPDARPLENEQDDVTDPALSSLQSALRALVAASTAATGGNCGASSGIAPSFEHAVSPLSPVVARGSTPRAVYASSSSTLGHVLAVDDGELPDASTLRPKARSELRMDVTFG